MIATSKRRSKDAIIVQILEVCMGGANKTNVVYQTNLNFHTVNPYLDSLTKNGMIDILPEEVPLYRTTEKGVEALEKLKELQELFSQVGPGN